MAGCFGNDPYDRMIERQANEYCDDTIECPVCGTRFEPTTWNNIYCNPECSKNNFLKERNNKMKEPKPNDIILTEERIQLAVRACVRTLFAGNDKWRVRVPTKFGTDLEKSIAKIIGDLPNIGIMRRTDV